MPFYVEESTYSQAEKKKEEELKIIAEKETLEMDLIKICWFHYGEKRRRKKSNWVWFGLL